MAGNFSLDDILAEIDAKKTEKSDKPKADSVDLSVTAIINQDELNAAMKSGKAGAKRTSYSVTEILNENKTKQKNREKAQTEKPAPAAPTPKPVPQKAAEQPVKEYKEESIPQQTAPAAAEKAQTAASERAQIADDEKAQSVKSEQPQTVKAEKPQAAETEKTQVFKAEKPQEIASEAALSEETRDNSEKNLDDAKQKKPVLAKAEKAAGEGVFAELKEEPKSEQKPKLVKKPEYNTEQRKLIDTQLQAEEDFDDPEELIDAFNPYEVKSKAADLSALLGGDTLGIAGNDLKQLAEASSREKAKLVSDEVKPYIPKGSGSPVSETAAATIETTAPVKQYIPQKEKEAKGKAAEKHPAHKQTEKERRSNDALLEKLNLALSKKRLEEEEKKRTMGLSEGKGTSELLKAPTNGLNLDDERVIMATGVIPESEELKSGSKRKLRDFVMENDNDDEEEPEEDFDSYDSTGQIWADLCESHKVIKIRFVLLFALTVFMFFVALMGDLNNGMVFKLFSFDVTFLDRRADVQGFLFYNLICGVFSAAVCASVLSNGLSKLFRLRADCDSVCAVTAMAAILTTAVNITSSDDMLLSRAYVYIPVAIAGLMFNTLGKLMMVTRAKRNFRFISGDTAKYSAVLVENNSASALTKGVTEELPKLAAMRKTELLTDFLKSSYCEDKADRLSRKLAPAALGAALLAALIAFVIPYGTEGLNYNIYWTLTVLTAALAVATPFSMMFVVNIPLTRAGKSLAKNESVVLGYQAAEEFSEVNSVMVDASLLFPAGTVTYSNIKHCKQPNSVNNIALDQAIILAASLAIKSGSVMSNMFKDMINDKDDILVKVENCVYEDNLGVLGWYGNKRLIMGSRDQMKHHDIKVPEMKKVKKYAGDTTETIYLSVAGEVVIMFFVELIPNPNIKACLQELTDKEVSIVIKTTDSIITVAKIAEVYEIPPERIRILPYSMHELFYAFTRYTSRGSGAVSCNGTFSGFANAVSAAKKVMGDIGIGVYVMLAGGLIGVAALMAAAFTGNSQLLTPSMVMGWNVLWLLLTAAAQSIRRY